MRETNVEILLVPVNNRVLAVVPQQSTEKTVCVLLKNSR